MILPILSIYKTNVTHIYKRVFFSENPPQRVGFLLSNSFEYLRSWTVHKYFISLFH